MKNMTTVNNNMEEVDNEDNSYDDESYDEKDTPGSDSENSIESNVGKKRKKRGHSKQMVQISSSSSSSSCSSLSSSTLRKRYRNSSEYVRKKEVIAGMKQKERLRQEKEQKDRMRNWNLFIEEKIVSIFRRKFVLVSFVNIIQSQVLHILLKLLNKF